MSSLLELKDISKIYHLGDNIIHALRNVNLAINQGELVAIVGSSGSGKSSLMNIMGFLDSPTSGSYYFSGKDVSNLSDQDKAEIRNRKIGFVFQSFFLLPRLTALQNVILPLFYRGVPREQAKEQALAMLDKLAIRHLAEHKPQQLSGGQQQRAAIARALITDPALILADEPTGALDTKTGNEVMDLFLNLNRQEGRTIVIITHDTKVSQLCERVVEIKDGEINLTETTKDQQWQTNIHPIFNGTTHSYSTTS